MRPISSGKNSGPLPINTSSKWTPRGPWRWTWTAGLPAAKQPYFDLLNDNILTTRIQVEAAILPEETREWIPAGTQLSFLRTDCQSYVDMGTEDGREYRIFVDVSQWPATVNGIPTDECFDGMLYTG